MHLFSLEGFRCLVVSRSQSDGLSRPCQCVAHSPRRIRVAPREEWLEGHDASGAKSRTSRNASQSTFRETQSSTCVSGTYSVVPERDRISLPVEAHLEVYIAANLLEQEVQDGVRFGLGNADDATGETWIDVDTLPAGYRVNADDGVDRLNGFSTNVESGSAGSVSLGHRAVEGGKALQVGLHPRAKGRVEGVPVDVSVRQVCILHPYRSMTHPELHRVSPPYSGPVMTLRDVVLGGWISYVTSLCQSSNFENAVESGRRAASLYTTVVGVSSTDLHPLIGPQLTVNFLESGFLGDRGCRVFVKRTEVPGEGKLFVNVQILVSED